jgi:outer membrane receptor protein involved in Fe transport
MPNAELKLQGAYLLAEKFMIRADVFAMTKRYGNSFSDTAQTKFEAIKVPGLVDFNVGCDYRYSKYVSAFINFNNLTAVRYQRWYHYPVSGFNLLAGLTMTF